ncbi:MAG: hypothetical protein RJA70_3530 [Pseudomonadota bacterium]|jgi:hypothetical protein
MSGKWWRLVGLGPLDGLEHPQRVSTELAPVLCGLTAATRVSGVVTGSQMVGNFSAGRNGIGIGDEGVQLPSCRA